MAESRGKLLIATTSTGKLREWQTLLDDLPLELLTSSTSPSPSTSTTGSTYAANALLKAEAYGKASQLLTLAEDSGLSVAAMSGGPGVRSARWEGDAYVHKNALLIRLLEDKHGGARGCRYVCAVIVRHPDGRLWRVRGEVRGQIATQPRAAAGSATTRCFISRAWVRR